MVISSITGATNQITVKDVPKVESTVTESQVVRKPSNQEIENIMSTEQFVRQYFSDIPIMIQVAKCESQFRQLDKDGDVHRGVENNEDVGVMQINEFYHLDKSLEKDYNIYTIEGNTAYARDLYQRQGTAPWSSSKACWGKYESKTDSKALAINTKPSKE